MGTYKEQVTEVANAISSLTYSEMMQFAASLRDNMECFVSDNNKFDPDNPEHYAKLMAGWAEAVLTADE